MTTTVTPIQLRELARRAVQTDDGHKYLVPARDLVEYNTALRAAADQLEAARADALREAAAIARDVRRRELDLHQCSFDEMPEANRAFVYGADRTAEYIEAAA